MEVLSRSDSAGRVEIPGEDNGVGTHPKTAPKAGSHDGQAWYTQVFTPVYDKIFMKFGITVPRMKSESPGRNAILEKLYGELNDLEKVVLAEGNGYTQKALGDIKTLRQEMEKYRPVDVVSFAGRAAASDVSAVYKRLLRTEVNVDEFEAEVGKIKASGRTADIEGFVSFARFRLENDRLSNKERAVIFARERYAFNAINPKRAVTERLRDVGEIERIVKPIKYTFLGVAEETKKLCNDILCF